MRRLRLPMNQLCIRLFAALYFLVFFSIIECANRIARELGANEKRETLQGELGSGGYILQVAGCRLKFNYNWKTAGTKNN